MSSSAFRQRWYRRAQCLTQRAPAEVQSWLFDTSSLTARLLRLCPGRFSVELLSQQVGKPTLDEADALGLVYGDSALIRQVHLRCGDSKVVFARTVIPLKTLQGAQRSYANLGNRPLGAMLFSDRSMRREVPSVSRLEPGDQLYSRTGAAGKSVWGRRSVFRVGGKPLLVSEFYLPELFKGS